VAWALPGATSLDEKERLMKMVLKTRLSVVLIGAGLIMVPSGCLWAETPAPNQEEVIQKRVQSLEKKYGLQIFYRDFSPLAKDKLVFKLPEPEDYETLARFLKLFDKEVAKYPVNFFRRGKVLTVVFVKRNFYDEKPAEGLYNVSGHFILIDFCRNKGHSAVQRRSIHHEFFHMIEIESRVEGRVVTDWEKMNPVGFAYGPPKERVLMGGNKYNNMAPAVAGFVTEYATTGPEEDRAEIFASLMLPASQEVLLRWAKRDHLLAEKMEAMKKYLLEYDSRLDQNFWDGIVSPDGKRGK
jgi:hypothetical protein